MPRSSTEQRRKVFPAFRCEEASFRNGALESVTEITEVRKQAFPASTFEAPAGFRKEAMPGGERR
jgi:hypothetical protein